MAPRKATPIAIPDVWSSSVGEIPQRVVVREEPTRGWRLYLWWRTPAGCERILTEIGQRKAALVERSQQRSVSEREPYTEELARLSSLYRDVHARRGDLMVIADGDRWLKAFKRATKEHVSEEEYALIVEAAKAIVEAGEDLPSTARGPVLDYRSTGGGSRERR